MNLILAWLIAALIFLTVELFSPGLFFFLSFFVGALGASALAAVTESVVGQTICFFSLSAITFIALRFWIKRKHVHSHYQSNAYALIGKRGVVISEVTPISLGAVKVQGELWSAKLVDTESIPKGAVVEVVNVVGCHVVVKQYSSAKEQQ